MTDIWKDPRIVEALEERYPDDIAVLDCPKCGQPGYYNEGSHFTCLACKVDFYVLGEGETAKVGIPSVSASEARRLSDCVDEGEV